MADKVTEVFKPNFKGSDGDWICTDPLCGNVNFARRSTCNRCGAEKPIAGPKLKKAGIEIGKAMAEKSRGLFSADDWQCSKCGNVNWARRKDCNVCNAPKFGPVEERTGLGGGFNERENVEYNRHESDEEDMYDEFGRIKKQKRAEVQEEILKRSIIAKPSEPDEEEEEDEEDGDLSKYKLESDDDDDNVDISKYKLDDDDDNNDITVKKKSDERDRQKSRSRSVSSYSSTSDSSSSSSSRSRSRSRSGSRQRHLGRSRSRSPNRRRKRSRSRSDSRSRSYRSRSRSHDSTRERLRYKH